MTKTEPISLVIPHTLAGLRLDQALSKMLPDYSRARLQGWIKEDLVRVDDQSAIAKQKVWGGERVQVTPQAHPEENAFKPQAMDLAIVYEDETILVINKPAGLVVHPAAGNWEGTLLNALLHHRPALAQIPRAGIVHRLDKDTTGLLVVACTLEAQTDLVRQLQARTVSRRYIAVVSGAVRADGVVDAPIGRHPVHRTRMAVVPTGRPARTHYAVRDRLRDATALECRLETGRTHQIRVHMASIGHPLLGDDTYAPRPVAAQFDRQALHAWRLGLIHPKSGADVAWEVPLPDDLVQLIDSLRASR